MSSTGSKAKARFQFAISASRWSSAQSRTISAAFFGQITFVNFAVLDADECLEALILSVKMRRRVIAEEHP